jgi:hypothetical protein
MFHVCSPAHPNHIEQSNNAARHDIYFDPAGREAPATQRTQKWYPAPRMMYGNPSAPGTSARAAAFGMTLERRVRQRSLQRTLPRS